MNIAQIIIKVTDSASAGTIYLDNFEYDISEDADATLTLSASAGNQINTPADATLTLSASAVPQLQVSADAEMTLAADAEAHHKYFGKVPTPKPWELPTEFPPFKDPVVARHVRNIRR